MESFQTILPFENNLHCIFPIFSGPQITTIEGRCSAQAEADVQKPLVSCVLPSSIFLGQVAQEPLMTLKEAVNRTHPKLLYLKNML